MAPAGHRLVPGQLRSSYWACTTARRGRPWARAAYAGSRAVPVHALRRSSTLSAMPEAPPTGVVRLGNPANGDAPRPAGACRILMIGDVIGKPGRLAVEALLPDLRGARGIDFVTANGENLAGGMGQ